MSEQPREEPPPLGRLSAPVTRLSHRSLDAGSSSKSSRLERFSVASELTRESLTAYLEKRSPGLERSSVTRANQEMSSRSDYPVRCSLSLAIREVESGDGVYYKFDGQRFAYSDATVKIQARSTYELTLVAKPHMDIAPNVLHIRAIDADAVPKQNVVFLTKRRAEGNGFEGNWKCDLTPNGKSQRVELTLSGQFKHFGSFDLPLLLKVYDHSHKGAYQGFKLKWVVFELSRKHSGDGLVQLDSVRYMS